MKLSLVIRCKISWLEWAYPWKIFPPSTFPWRLGVGSLLYQCLCIVEKPLGNIFHALWFLRDWLLENLDKVQFSITTWRCKYQWIIYITKRGLTPQFIIRNWGVPAHKVWNIYVEKSHQTNIENIWLRTLKCPMRLSISNTGHYSDGLNSIGSVLGSG